MEGVTAAMAVGAYKPAVQSGGWASGAGPTPKTARQDITGVLDLLGARIFGVVVSGA
jgi:hypothetical protein